MQFLVSCSGRLGGQVVRQLLQYWLPVMHAVFAQIVFAAVLESRCLRANGGYRSVRNWWTAGRFYPDLAIVNATVIFLQVVLGAGFAIGNAGLAAHGRGACGLATVTWTAGALRRRFGTSSELRGRVVCFMQFLAFSFCWVLGLIGDG